MKCIITTEGFGDMVFELYPGLAPVTVKNFVDTVNSGFYNGLAWCRIVKDYVIQAGSPDNDIMTDSERLSLIHILHDYHGSNHFLCRISDGDDFYC